MPPTITPPQPGATAYTATDTRHLHAELILPVGPAGAAVEVRFPTAATDVRAALVRGGVRLELLPGPVNDGGAGPPTFPDRLVLAEATPDGAQTVLACRVVAPEAAAEPWVVALSAARPTRFTLTLPAADALARLVIDPDADFTLGGEVRADSAPPTVGARAVVQASARPPAAAVVVVRAPTAPAPTVRYEWTVDGRPPADLVTEDAGRVASFTAPGAAPADLPLTLTVTTDIGPTSARSRAIRVTPATAPLAVGPEVPLRPAGGLEFDLPYWGSDGAAGLVAAWWDSNPPPGQPTAVRAFPFAPLKLAGGAGSPVQTAVETRPTTGVWPAAARRPGTGDTFVAVQASADAAPAVQLRVGPLAALGPPERVAGAADGPMLRLVVTEQVAAVVFSSSDLDGAGGGSGWHYRRWNLAGGGWLDAAPKRFPVGRTGSRLVATADGPDTAWVAHEAEGGPTGFHVRAARWNLTTDSWADALVAPGVFRDMTNQAGLALGRAGAGVWLFWSVQRVGVRAARFTGLGWEGPVVVPNTIPGGPAANADMVRAAAGDAAGRVWLFFNRAVFGGKTQPMGTAFDPAAGTWSEPLLLAAEGSCEAATVTPGGVVWVALTRTAFGSHTTNLSCVRVIPASAGV